MQYVRKTTKTPQRSAEDSIYKCFISALKGIVQSFTYCLSPSSSTKSSIILWWLSLGLLRSGGMQKTELEARVKRVRVR